MTKYICFNDITEVYELIPLTRHLANKDEIRDILVNSSLIYNDDIRKLLTQYTRDHNIQKLCEDIQLPYQFIRDYKSKLDPYWSSIIRNTMLTEDVLSENLENIIPHWFLVLAHQKLSDEFMEEHMDLIDADNHYWAIISTSQYLSERFLLKYFDKFYWERVLANHKLPDKVLVKVCRTFKIDKWREIIIHQNISDSFIEEFADLIEWPFAIVNNKVSSESQNKFKDLIYCQRKQTIAKKTNNNVFDYTVFNR